MEKKSNVGLVVGLVVVLVLSVLVSLGLLGYICYDKLLKNDVKVVRNCSEVDVTVAKDLSKEDVSIFLDRIELFNHALCEYYPLSDIGKVPNQKLLSMAVGGFTSDVKAETYIKSIIGDNVNVKHEDILCAYDNIPLYNYNNGYYFVNNDHPGHGGSGRFIYTYFLGAVNQGDEVIIKTNILYSKPIELAGPTKSLYDGVDDSAKLVLDEVEDSKITEEYEKIKDTLPVTTFTFKRSELAGFNLVSVDVK